MTSVPSGLPELIADEEDLARFLTQSGHYNATMVKPVAFLPSPRDRQTSVSRHGAEPLPELWALGLSAAGSRTLHGAAILKAISVKTAGLEVVPDEPPLRHALIRNWPWNESDPELQKVQQKERAALLASAAGKPLLRQV